MWTWTVLVAVALYAALAIAQTVNLGFPLPHSPADPAVCRWTGDTILFARCPPRLWSTVEETVRSLPSWGGLLLLNVFLPTPYPLPAAAAVVGIVVAVAAGLRAVLRRTTAKA